MADHGNKKQHVGSNTPAVFLSFHRRKLTRGGGEHVSENFREIVRRTIGGSVLELFHDDPAQTYNHGSLRINVRRRNDMTVALRLFALGKLGRQQFGFHQTDSATKELPLLFVDGVGHASVLQDSSNKFQQSIILHHNFEPDYYADEYFGKWQKPWFVRAGFVAERTAMRQAEVNLFLTRNDLNKTVSTCGQPKLIAEVFGVYEPILPLVYHPAPGNDRLRVLVTGNLSSRKGYLGTIEMLRFARKCKERLVQKMQFVVAGRNPSEEMLALADGKFIEIVANPPSIGQIAQSCDVYLNPNFTGSGIKIRNFDGLRNGIPVYCRAENAAGFEDLGSPAFQTFTDPNVGISLLEALPISEVKSARMREQIWKTYSERFNLDAGVSRLRCILEKLRTVDSP